MPQPGSRNPNPITLHSLQFNIPIFSITSLRITEAGIMAASFCQKKHNGVGRIIHDLASISKVLTNETHPVSSIAMVSFIENPASGNFLNPSIACSR